MVSLTDALIGRTSEECDDGLFRFRPEGWTLEGTRTMARQEGLELLDDHLVLICSLQEFFLRHKDKPSINLLKLHDALEEKFHYKGGLKYLYQICPGGPVVQGCRLAGLKVPAGAVDLSYGSVA